MIFDVNRTSLGSSIPMAEGYDGTVGAAQALVESARNDYAMFRAMLDADARELSLRKSGYVAESEILALQEATGSGIWNKIVELIKKLIAKIKAIFASFLAKFRGLYMDDKKLIKNYGDKIIRKGNIGNMKIKWRKVNNTSQTAIIGDITKLDIDSIVGIMDDKSQSFANDNDAWSSDSEKRWKHITHNISSNICANIENQEADSASELKEKLNDAFWTDDSPDTYDFKDIFGTARALVVTFDGLGKSINDYEKSVNKATSKLDQKLKEINKKADDAAKKSRGKDASGNDITDSDSANHTYTIATTCNDIILVYINFSLEVYKEYYKQTKAVFVKAAAVNDKKLEESSVYAQAVAEAAEQEVEDVISGAISDEELSKINNASKNVLDSGVSDDPDKLVYDPDYYTDNQSYVKTDGYKDSTIVGTEESSFFGKLLY